MRTWHDIVEPYRAEAWAECARLVRAHVDQDPHDLSTRALLASLLLRTRQRTLALMQYEHLLPLAVGRGQLFRALATQRRLDELHPPAQRHPDRYRAIQDWFRSLSGPPAGGAAPARRGIVAPLRGLLELPPETFSSIAEQSEVIALDMTPQVVSDPAGVLWAVHFGRVRWALVRGPGGARDELIAADGDVIHLPPGSPSERWLELEPETPCEVIRFDPRLLETLRCADRTEGRAGGPEEPDPAHAGAPPAAPPALQGGAAETAGPIPLAAPVVRPRPDPLAEPTLAAGVPRDRRRETRMAVTLENRVVLLGEVGSKVPPLHGTVVDVSASGLGLRFPAAQIRHARSIQPQAFVRLQIGLRDAEDLMSLIGRIAWIEWRPVAEGERAEDARIGLEFVAMSAENRAGLERLLESAGRPDA